MPRRNIYVRPENMEAWEVSGKSKWINSLLTTDAPAEIGGYSGIIEPIETVFTSKLAKAQEEKGVDFCSHNQVKGFCKKGCK